MANSFFKFKQFTIHQDRCAMKVTTDGCLFGAYISHEIKKLNTTVTSADTEIKKILDIGTGTGLLSLMIAQKSEVLIDAVEIDKMAAIQALENINASPFSDQINIINEDIKCIVSAKKYDVIISNPPFYENELKGTNKEKNIAHHSQHLLISELLSIIKNKLTAGGNFFLLLPYKRIEELYKLTSDNNLQIQDLIFLKQTTTHNHFRIMLKGGLIDLQHPAINKSEISIKDEQNQYTGIFNRLLKDYYLNF